MAQPEFSIQDMIDNAIGEKPATVQKAFDSVITQKVADIIGGKKQSFNKGLFDPVLGSELEDEDFDDEALEAEPSEEEADEVIDELEADGPEEEEESEVEEIEDEEQEDTADADVEEEDGEIT